MKTSGVRIAKSRLLVLASAFLFLVATFPGKGGLEGNQREIPLLADRTDNWGFIVPFVVGNWPDFLGHWRFSLVLFQLTIFWIGSWLLLRKAWAANMRGRSLISVLMVASSVFVSQLWRDASLLALATFGLGILSTGLGKNRKTKVVLFFFAVLILHLAAMFKVLYGVILGLFFLWILIQKGNIRTIAKIASFFVFLSLTFVPYFADKQFSSIAGLQKVFPEQQPMIFDLASNYCWGQSDQLINDAAEGLQIVLKPRFPLPAVCGSLRPNSWDNLHSSPFAWEFNSPIQRIVGDKESQVSELRSKWFSMIVNNPVDWAQTRLMYLGWTLTLSNSYVPQNYENTFRGFFGMFNSILWKIFFVLASSIDKARLTSIMFALVIVFLLLLRSAITSSGSRILFFRNSIPLFASLIVLLSTTVVTLIGFVASNGRYVLPYVILTYILLFWSQTFGRQVRFDH